MKRLFFVVFSLLMSLSIQAQQKQISYIKNDGAWYMVYDESGKKISTVSKSTIGELVGWGLDFFVSFDGSWYKIYDLNGRKINTLSKSTVGKVIAVSGSTFISEDGGWIKTYNRNGKLRNTKSKFSP